MLREQARNALIQFGMHEAKDELETKTKDLSRNVKEYQKTLVMVDIGNDIVKYGKISRSLVHTKIRGIMTEGELRRTKIFAYHHSSSSYTFSSRALKTVFEVSIYSLFISLFI